MIKFYYCIVSGLILVFYISWLFTKHKRNCRKLDDALKQIGEAIDSGTFQGRKLNPQEIEQLKRNK